MNENTEEYKYELDTWEGGTLVTPAKVDLTTGIVTPAVYSGNTPITPERLEIMNQGIKKLYEEGAISKDIYIGPEEDAPSEAKIIIDSNQMKTKASEVVNSLEGNETNLAPSVQAVNNALLDIYSTEEVQIGWFIKDGIKKPYYRKVINIGTITANTQKLGKTGISNLDIMLDSKCTCLYTNGAWHTISPENAFIYNNGVDYSVLETSNATKCTMSLLYTKTTDEGVNE